MDRTELDEMILARSRECEEAASAADAAYAEYRAARDRAEKLRRGLGELRRQRIITWAAESQAVTGFWIEMPADEHGNTAAPKAVVEGMIVQGGPECGLFSNPDRRAILFTAPADYAARWRGFYTDAYGGYGRVDGPARLLGREEYEALTGTVTEVIR